MIFKIQSKIIHLTIQNRSGQYQVTIQTSSIAYAGTNSAFYYSFVGSKGRTSEYKADAAGDDREPGHVNTWLFTDTTDIGKFECLRIRMDGSDGWHFEEVGPD